MSFAALLLAVLAQDKPVIIDRLHPQKDRYDHARRTYEQALKLLDTDPDAALQKITEIHDRLDQPDRPGLQEFEKTLRFEDNSGDYSPPLPFYPFQVRGRARLKLAALSKSVEERRRLLTDAAADFQKSVEKGVESSGTLLKETRAEIAKLPPPLPPAPTAEELAASWSKEWNALRPRLSYGSFAAEDSAVPVQAARLFGRMAAEASPRDQVDVAGWISLEVAGAKPRVKSLSRDEARRMVLWTETLAAALAGLEPFKASRESLSQFRSEAVQIAEYRGSFTLKIGPSPYAEEVRVLREGREIVLPGRSTPLVLSRLEIGDYTVELTHPGTGKRTVSIPAASLSEGRTYILHGKMAGELAVAPLP